MRRNVITTIDELRQVVEDYQQFDEFSFDSETVGEDRADPQFARATWLSLGGQGRTDVIPFGHVKGELQTAAYKEKLPWWDENDLTKKGKPRKKWYTVNHPDVFSSPPTHLWPSDVFETLRPLFFSDRTKIGHNLKFDLHVVAKYFGAYPPPPYADTLIAGRLLNSTRKNDLKNLTKLYFDVEYDKEETAKKGIDNFSFSHIANYAALDSRYTWLLWKKLSRELMEKRLANVFKLEMDLLPVLLDMEAAGVLVDVEGLEKLRRELGEQLLEIEKEVYSIAGHAFNIDSTPQKEHFVYDIRGHKPFAYTKGNKRSTAAGVLEAYAAQDEVVQRLLDYADIKKIHSTYVGEWDEENQSYKGGLLALVRDERLHADFNQVGAETGRLSCRKPNLQNIPRRGDKSHLIRSLFIAPEGYSLVCADYGQIEYRVLAHFCEDPTLIDAFKTGFDPHSAVIAQLYKIPIDQVTAEQRDVGKTLNFAIIYGAGPAKIANTAKVSLEEAKRLMKEHQKRFPRIYSWKNQQVKLARKNKPPSVRTITGRMRLLPALWSNDDDKRSAAERRTINTLVQGTAGDIIKIAMVRVHQALPNHSQLLISIHDELVVVTPDEHVEETSELVQNVMKGVDILSVPMEAEAKSAKSWADAK